MDGSTVFVLIVIGLIVGAVFYFKKHRDKLAELQAKAKEIESSVEEKFKKK